MSSGVALVQIAWRAVQMMRKLSDLRSAWMVAVTMMVSSLLGSTSKEVVR